MDSDRFHCSYCNASYKQKKNLVRHIKGRHGEGPLQCTWCDKAFYRTDYLRRHVQKKHPDYIASELISLIFPPGAELPSNSGEEKGQVPMEPIEQVSELSSTTYFPEVEDISEPEVEEGPSQATTEGSCTEQVDRASHAPAPLTGSHLPPIVHPSSSTGNLLCAIAPGARVSEEAALGAPQGERSENEPDSSTNVFEMTPPILHTSSLRSIAPMVQGSMEAALGVPPRGGSGNEMEDTHIVPPSPSVEPDSSAAVFDNPRGEMTPDSSNTNSYSYEYPGLEDVDCRRIDMKEATLMLTEMPAGNIMKWTPKTSILLMAPAVVLGVGIPSWWSRQQALKGLDLRAQDLTSWTMSGVQAMEPVLDLADHIVDWWETRLGYQDDGPRSPSPSPSPSSVNQSPMDTEDEDIIVISDTEVQRELADQWKDIEDWEVL